MSDCSGLGQQVSDLNIRLKRKQDNFLLNSIRLGWVGWMQCPKVIGCGEVHIRDDV